MVISVPPTSAIPQPPNQFWGTVTVSGSPAVDGLIVSARIGGVEYKSTTTSGGSYGVIVPADDPGTPGKEGGVNGETVEFYVAGVKAAETGTFSIGGVTKLDLTVVDNTAPTVTLPAHTPDPENDNTPTYSGTATDALTKVVDIEYRVDSGTWTDVDAFTPALSVDFTFTTPALADGTHTIYVKAKDNAGNWSDPVSDTLTVTVVLPDFSISVSPGSGSVTQGGSTTATVTVSSLNGFSSTVSLSLSGQPSGVSLSPTSGTPSFTSTLSVSSSTPAGDYTITITGTGGGKTHTCNFALTVTTVVVPGVPDFSISVSTTSESAVQGGSTSATASVSSINGFSSTVSLSASGLPSGATATFSPTSGTPSFTSTLMISTASTTSAGTYTITITGTGGGKTNSTTFTLTVEEVVPLKAILAVDTTPVKASVYVDGSLWGIAPQTQHLDAGTYVVTFGGYLGYLTPTPQTVVLAENETRTVTGVYTEIPAENIENQSPTQYIPQLEAGENATILLENTAISEITIEAENTISGATVTVQQLTGRPAEIAIGAPGVTYKYLNIVTENLTDAQIRSVTIRFSVEKSWIAANGIDISTITLNRYDPVTGEWTSLPTEKVGEDATYVYFSAVSPGLSVFAISGTTAVPPVADFIISVSPTSGSIVQGGLTTATVSVSPIEGFSQTVSLSASGLPSGTTASFSPSSGTPSFSSTLTISTASTTLAGTYTITITGTGGGKTHSCTYTLTVTSAAVPPKPFPWDLVIGIIAAIVVVVVILALLYKRRR